MMLRVAPLLLLLFVFGCTKNEVQDVVGSGLAIPDVIDIGQVRAKDSPAKTSFSITNHAATSVAIDEILSGCGCMVIDLPQKIILSNETIEVPVKINFLGKRGDFHTDILVRLASDESRHIRIIGKVIEDIWYVGQSIRFHIDPNQEVVSRDFSISTVDYPDVQFELETDDSDLHISELSRSTYEGETRILFQLTVHNAQAFRTSSHLELIPTNVDLPKLTIPVFYHHLLGEPKQWLSTSQVNLGEIKRDVNITVKVYGDRNFLRNVHTVQAESKDDVITVVSHTTPVSDSDPLEVIITVGNMSEQGLVRGSLTLFSHDDESVTVQASGIVRESIQP